MVLPDLTEKHQGNALSAPLARDFGATIFFSSLSPHNRPRAIQRIYSRVATSKISEVVVWRNLPTFHPSAHCAPHTPIPPIHSPHITTSPILSPPPPTPIPLSSPSLPLSKSLFRFSPFAVYPEIPASDSFSRQISLRFGLTGNIRTCSRQVSQLMTNCEFSHSVCCQLLGCAVLAYVSSFRRNGTFAMEQHRSDGGTPPSPWYIGRT